ncbi:LTA synthase family protein [Bifidobacterium sp.]|uniref:LTA synthase family protein n=1 Tax=Bifidobacterium sp. TaxID=41200 RepID=UPI0025C31159|nr:LTA synthase family protein [Bifidobacterium sp.]MCH4209236.1 LTA synthase family protein [Bifidobacterium sp.]MCI1224653.1 LTA synthase family protein [Bifidobacterium sp.]
MDLGSAREHGGDEGFTANTGLDQASADAGDERTGDGGADDGGSQPRHMRIAGDDTKNAERGKADDRAGSPGGNGGTHAAPAGASRFSLGAYGVLFLLFDIAGVGMMQWGVTVSSSGSTLPGPLIGLWNFAETIWKQQRNVFYLNLVLLGLIYLTLLFLINHFWITTPVIMGVCMVFALIERFKVQSRYETVLPSDFDFLNADAGNIASFLPAGAQRKIIGGLLGLLALIVLCVVANHFDLRHGRIILSRSKAIGASVRIVGALVPGIAVSLFISAVGTVDSWANNLALNMGDIPSMWDSVYDAQRNGTLLAFSRQLNPKVMDEPANYSEATMKAVLKRYEKAANTINTTRTANLNDGSVIFVLSESFSDPTRVPGVNLNKDPMPYIRSVKDSTTSGLMLSSGYGGGTANLEFQALTGLSMANFDPSLTSPYQQLVPALQWTPSINQLWNGGKNSVAFHPFVSSMYSRSSDYKKFKFPHFYTLDKPDVIKYSEPIDRSPYASDEQAYKNVTEWLQGTPGNRFVQLVTMQNHMPFNNWYDDNEFAATAPQGSAALGSDETMAIQTYAKGVSHTDNATRDFLASLDKENRPITVMFYGDHLPGIYSTAGADNANSIALHETDYFIWSNKASASAGAKLDDSAYSSPNFFMAQTAEHMNAKVSPYLAFLTQLHGKISAMEPPVINQIQGWTRIPAGQTIYLDNKGNPMSAVDFDAATRQLVNDYKLIQYDITAGKHYLETTDFMTMPGGGAMTGAAADASASSTSSSANLSAAVSTLASTNPANGVAAGSTSQREGQVNRSRR